MSIDRILNETAGRASVELYTRCYTNDKDMPIALEELWVSHFYDTYGLGSKWYRVTTKEATKKTWQDDVARRAKLIHTITQPNGIELITKDAIVALCFFVNNKPSVDIIKAFFKDTLYGDYVIEKTDKLRKSETRFFLSVDSVRQIRAATQIVKYARKSLGNQVQL